MKLVSYMVGSEVRWLTETFPTDFRKIPYLMFVKFRAWALRPFIQEYWVDNEYLVPFIHRFKKNAKTRVVEEPFTHCEKYPKKDHLGFNILYYFPPAGNITYRDWVYGKDIFDQLVPMLPQVNWIIADGTLDMKETYPIVDFYLRPNRHDGDARMRRECEVQEIPFYWTQTNPDIEEAYGLIMNEIHKQQFLTEQEYG